MEKKSAYILSGILVLIAASLGAIISAALMQSKKVNQTTAQISQNTSLLFQSERVLSLLVDNETGSRGFTLTGNEKFLEPLQKSKATINAELQQLKTLLNTKSETGFLFDTLTFYIEKRMLFSDKQIVVRKEKGPQYAAALMAEGEGKFYMDKIRSVIRELQEDEGYVLMEGQQQSSKQQKKLNNFIAGLSVILFLLLAGIALLIKNVVNTHKNVAAVNKLLSLKLADDVKQKNAELDNVFSRISDAFVALDNNWCYTYVNKKAEELLRYTAPQLLGKNIWEVFPEAVGNKFYGAYHQAFNTQQYLHVEEYYEGYDVWLENHIYPSPNGISIFFRNITLRKKHEQSLEESSLFINSLITSSPDIIYIYDITETKNVFVNNGIQTNLGYTNEEIRQMGSSMLSDLMHPDDLGYYINNTFPKYKTLKDNEVIATEYRMKDKQGNWHWLSSKESVYLRTPDELPRQIFGSARDITESKLAEEELRISKEVLETAEDQAGLGSWSYDVATGKIFWSKQMYKLFGFDENIPVPEFADYITKIHPDDRGIILERYNILKSGEKPVSKIFRSNPAIMPLRYFFPSLRVIKDADNKTTQMLGIVLEVTERVLAEKEIENRGNQLKTLSDNLPDTMIYQLVMENDGHKHFTYLSKSIEALTGYTAQQAIADPKILYNLIHEEDRELFTKAEEESFKNMSVFNVEVRSRDKYGVIRWLNIRSMPRHLDDGRIIWDGVHTDITERKKAEQEIAESEKRYRSTLDKMLEGMQIIGHDWKYLYLNNSACKHGAYTKEELLGHTMMEKYPDIEKTELFAVLQKCMKERKQQFMLNHFVYPDGSAAWFELSIQPVPEGLFILSIDVTDRKLAEQEIQIVNKELHDLSAHLETVREDERIEIARDIHDELGQQLTGLKLGIEWVSLKIPEANTALKEKTREIVEQTKGIIHAVRRISSNLRPSMLDDLGLAAALEWQSQEVEKRYGITVNFETATTNELPMKITNALFRIYQETLTNAVRHSEASLINSYLFIKGNDIILEIKDNGKGFDLNKKPNKKSFGLLGIKERAFSLEGLCKIVSKPGEGTAITIAIPLK